jgi:ribosomal protein S3AE
MAIAKRKKRFFEVEIPLIKKEVPLQAYEIEELAGRYVKYDLTRLLRGKGTVLTAKVEVNGHKAVANATSMVVLPYYIKRMLRKGTNYVEDSFSTECADALIRIKPFLITRRKVSRAVRKALRNKCKEEIIVKLKDKSTEDIMADLIRGSLQKQLSIVLKKVYPLALCEIRIIEQQKLLEKPAQNEKTEADSKTE